MSDLTSRLAAIEERIEAACSRAGRSREEITLVAVGKTFPAAVVDQAIAAGIGEIGENRVQEARDKIPAVQGGARWHMIGHLQSNKAKEAVRLFDVIQTVDSVDLAVRLERAAASAGTGLDVLIQVNLAGEEQKSGVGPESVPALADAIAGLPSLRLRGLMTLPPLVPGDDVRPYFRALRALRDRLAASCENCRELSMGMSDDFELAIEEGSTMIRIGRALFGDRG